MLGGGNSKSCISVSTMSGGSEELYVHIFGENVTTSSGGCIESMSET